MPMATELASSMKTRIRVNKMGSDETSSKLIYTNNFVTLSPPLSIALYNLYIAQYRKRSSIHEAALNHRKIKQKLRFEFQSKHRQVLCMFAQSSNILQMLECSNGISPSRECSIYFMLDSWLHNICYC